MTDEFAVCPNCSKIDTMRDITAMFQKVWTIKQLETLSKYLWCVECKSITPKEVIKYVHSKDEP